MDRRGFMQSSTALVGTLALSGWAKPVGKTPSATDDRGDRCRIQQPVRLFGVGGAGCNIVDQLSIPISMSHSLRVGRIKETRALDLTLASTDFSELCPDDKVLISQAVAEAQLTIVVAGLGGTTGSGVAPYVLKQAKHQGGECIAVYCRPFSFEDQARRMSAVTAIVSSWGLIGRERVSVFEHDETTSPNATFSEILACTDARMITAVVDGYLTWLSSPNNNAAPAKTKV